MVEKHVELLNAKSYEVRSSVPLGAFEAFVAALKSHEIPTVTPENAASLSMLAKEFGLSELESECVALSRDALSVLSDRMSKLEEQLSRMDQEELVGRGEPGHSPKAKPILSPSAPEPAASPCATSQVECPWDWSRWLAGIRPMEGIISHLTKKHGGNVHDKGIVTITSKSAVNGVVGNMADLTSTSFANSTADRGQWFCWDFHEMRVRLTHYAITGLSIKSWVVERSLDAQSWTRIGRYGTPSDWAQYEAAPFAVEKSAEYRFIRLRQTHRRDYAFSLTAVEFFGPM
jgi:hypothetical protein